MRRRPGEGWLSAISDTLTRLGVPEHAGRNYLADAVFLAGEDADMSRSLTRRMYPAVAARAGVSTAAVERALRHVIDTAWVCGDMDFQYRLFGSTIDAARGKPTSGGMIARLTQLMRMED